MVQITANLCLVSVTTELKLMSFYVSLGDIPYMELSTLRWIYMESFLGTVFIEQSTPTHADKHFQQLLVKGENLQIYLYTFSLLLDLLRIDCTVSLSMLYQLLVQLNNH